ncbi:tartrate transporter [Fusarium denticulatum]|uniref:Tartrate transporter n=1 Tax=Fusarium denticulatum TaxID=48507 RepID=A0A8H5XLA9_9HYPO|nr:tartrate transporter [Fusarium denticulatum]
MALLPEPQMSIPSKDVKPDAGIDAVHDEKILVQSGVDDHRGDYSGAASKTDPAEIALVRKLDRMIMVRPESTLSYSSLRCLNLSKAKTWSTKGRSGSPRPASPTIPSRAGRPNIQEWGKRNTLQ